MKRFHHREARCQVHLEFFLGDEVIDALGESAGVGQLGAFRQHRLGVQKVGVGSDPGVGRTPVPVPYEEFVAKFRAWADSGGPCPAVARGAREKTASLAP